MGANEEGVKVCVGTNGGSEEIKDGSEEEEENKGGQ